MMREWTHPEPNLAELGERYVNAGLSIIPIGNDKRPYMPALPRDPETGKLTWKPFQSQPADLETVRRWAAMSGVRGFAAVCGEASGGLLVLDFDVPRFFDRWRESVGELFEGLPLQRTGGGGYQLAIRCDDPRHNTVLAFMSDESQQTGRTIAIETRGEGGYAVLPGSLHPSGNLYEEMDGDWSDIPRLAMPHVRLLSDEAQKLNEAPFTKQQQERAARSKIRSRPAQNGREDVIGRWNAERPLRDVLQRHGYELCGPNRMSRPGKTVPSVTIFDDPERSFHHSTNDPLHDDAHTHDSFGVFCELEHGGDVRAAVKAAANELGINTESMAAGEDQEKVQVQITTEEHKTVEATIEALRADPDLYQRGGALVRIVHEDACCDGIVRPNGAPTIRAASAAHLRERMTRVAEFMRLYSREREYLPAHPPGWLVAAVVERGEWPGIRPLLGVSHAPILHGDGRVCQTAGYDPETAMLFAPTSRSFEPVPKCLLRDDAISSANRLLRVVGDFPFATEAHKAAWLAAVLTPPARSAFLGPAPLFLADANVRGSGKTLLMRVAGTLATGRDLSVTGYAHDSDEMRKKITAAAIAGDRLVLLDNVAGRFGNDALDRALTSTQWSDRILGKSERVALPLLTVWYATGNNVQVEADSARRIIHIRLDVLEEHPEHREDFEHADLMQFVSEHRPRLLVDAITILAAYLRAGRPDLGLRSFGSFEGWSGTVRSAIVWAGLPDPCETQETLAESDSTADILGKLLSAWHRFALDGTAFTVSELIARLYPPRGEQWSVDEASTDLRAAIDELTGARPDKPPGTRQLGNRLKAHLRRVVGGLYLDKDPNDSGRSGTRWRVYKV